MEKTHEKETIGLALIKHDDRFKIKRDFIRNRYIALESLTLEDVKEYAGEAHRLYAMIKAIVDTAKVDKPMLRDEARLRIYKEMTGEDGKKPSMAVVDLHLHKDAQWKEFLTVLKNYMMALGEFDSHAEHWERNFQTKRSMYVTERKAELGG